MTLLSYPVDYYIYYFQRINIQKPRNHHYEKCGWVQEKWIEVLTWILSANQAYNKLCVSCHVILRVLTPSGIHRELEFQSS